MTKARTSLTELIRASAGLARSAPLMWYHAVTRSERLSFPRHPGPDGPNAVRCPRSRDSRLRPATSQPARWHHTASERCRTTSRSTGSTEVRPFPLGSGHFPQRASNNTPDIRSRQGRSTGPRRGHFVFPHGANGDSELPVRGDASTSLSTAPDGGSRGGRSPAGPPRISSPPRAQEAVSAAAESASIESRRVVYRSCTLSLVLTACMTVS